MPAYCLCEIIQSGMDIPMIKKYQPTIYLIAAACYLELLFHLKISGSLSAVIFYPLLAGAVLGGFCGLLLFVFPARARRPVFLTFLFLACATIAVQLAYFNVFKTFLSLYSLRHGTGQLATIKSEVVSAVISGLPWIAAALLPLIAAFLKPFRFMAFAEACDKEKAWMILACLGGFLLYLGSLHIGADALYSPYALYHGEDNPKELSMQKLGFFTTVAVGARQALFSLDHSADTASADPENLQATPSSDLLADGNGEGSDPSVSKNAPDNGVENPSMSSAGTNPSDSEDTATPSNSQTGQAGANGSGFSDPVPTDTSPHVLDIDFDALAASAPNDAIRQMHSYFSSVTPTNRNEYTGMFKGYNLIFLTAESFSPYAVWEDLTPTLYKLVHEGFYFENFYNPVWGVSTSDGEYVACTGLIPKSGVWSFRQSSQNYLPFVMGNQFKALGYPTRAYHNHTYDYYRRDLSHPNMGYDYKGLGNGLEVRKTWPESDLEMMEKTVPEYIEDEHFHTYYMTVSGHMDYNFTGNYMAYQNRDLVKDLPYGEEGRAYIACNMELDRALSWLIEQLEAAGVADRTLIALSADHYPYGLAKSSLDELAGHPVEENFELYRSHFILWSASMEDPIVVSRPSSSLDIIPTLSNLLDLPYDSRLLMGVDLLSDAPSLVIFNNRSFITDDFSYNSKTGKALTNDGEPADIEKVKAVNQQVKDKFEYSDKILTYDYYRVLFPDGLTAGADAPQ